jgi:hypothetical protein
MLVTQERYSVPRRCSWPWGCDEYLGRELGRVETSAQVEVWIWRQLSAGVTVSLSHEVQAHAEEPARTLEQAGKLVIPTLPRTRGTSRVFASWAFIDRLGMTIDASGAFVSTPFLFLSAWSASVSLWFRFDERLQPRWLDH